MTICIGATCKGGKEAIVASDRMLTITMPPREFEHELPKLEHITERCIITAAGDALAVRELLKELSKKLEETKPTHLKDIASIVKESYQICRLRRIEDMALKSRGLNVQAYYQNIRGLPPEIYMGLDNTLANFNYNFIVLLAGVDEQGAHIYRILNPGVLDSFTKIGYCAIGSGEHLAVSSFITNNFSPLLPRNHALYLVYEAKKIAENAPGVGSETDIRLITSEGIEEIKKDTIKKLEEIYQKKNEIEKQSMEKIKDLIGEIFSRE